MKIGISIDVDDLQRAIDFYTRGLGLSVVERGPGWAHLTHEGQTIFIMQLPLGSESVENAHAPRDYSRHWTPVHLDFVVADVDRAVERALAAGANWTARFSAVRSWATWRIWRIRSGTVSI